MPTIYIYTYIYIYIYASLVTFYGPRYVCHPPFLERSANPRAQVDCYSKLTCCVASYKHVYLLIFIDYIEWRQVDCFKMVDMSMYLERLIVESIHIYDSNFPLFCNWYWWAAWHLKVEFLLTWLCLKYAAKNVRHEPNGHTRPSSVCLDNNGKVVHSNGKTHSV